MLNLVSWIDRQYYAEYRSNWDDERLRAEILRCINGKMKVLDIGAGAGRVKQMNFRGTVERIIGIDPDSRISENSYLDQAIRGSADDLPFREESFDLVFCDNVLEHLDEPRKAFQEIARVLRPGATFLAKTPNRKHYMPLIARLTPTGFHRFVNRLRGRRSEDTFPTRYRANTPDDVRRLSNLAGLEVVSIQLVEGRPEYLRFSFLTYIAGLVYERLVNSTSILAKFRILLLRNL